MKNKIPTWLIITFAVIAFLGFLDATYLTVSHYSGSELNCSIIEGCGEVTSSEYSTFLGVPVALFGAIYYITVLFLMLFFFDTRREIFLKPLAPLATLAFLSSVWFVYLQIFVIEAICQYCMASALTSTILFILSLILLKHQKNG